MTTPFEDSVMESLAQSLEKAVLAPDLIETLATTYTAEKLPSPDTLLQSIKEHSGEKTA